MTENSKIELELTSAEYLVREVNNLLNQYHSARIERQKISIRSKLIAMYGKLKFEEKILNRYVIPEEE